MVEGLTPIEVFICYAHADEAWLRKLKKHLSLLKRQDLISLWYDRLILPGSDWAKALDTHLETASVILLLVSADFFASDYCSGIEMKRALERQKTGEAQVIPILVRPADWKIAPFGHLQVLPTDAKPLSTWRNKDTALVDIAVGIRHVIEDLSLLPASAPRTIFPRIWNVPYQRNPFFIGREDMLIQLHRALQADAMVALSHPQGINGLGGIGKTQMALEYAYRYHQNYQAVLWARADSTSSLASSYVNIAHALNLPGCDAQEIDRIVEEVKRWLRDNTGWLLILDGADELELVKPFLPKAYLGHVLLTTRAGAVGDLAQRLEIEGLSSEVGALLLLRRAGLVASDAKWPQISPQEREMAMQISQEFGGLPLALDHAGAYMEMTSVGLATYWRLYQQHRTEFLQQLRGKLASDYPASVATTWAIAFEKIEVRDPVAAELLRLCAYFAPDDIAEEILIQGASHLGPLLEEAVTDFLRLNQAISVLRAYSLIHRNPVTEGLSIHRLVQTVLRDEISPEASRDWATRVISAVSVAFPSVDFRTWQLCQRYLPQAQVASEYIEKWDIVFPEGVNLLSRAGYYLWDRALYEEAEPFYKQLLMIYEKDLGDNHPKMAGALNNLARIYHLQKKYSDAALLYQRALRLKEQLSDTEDAELLSLLENYADLLRKTGQDQDLASVEARLRAVKRSQEHWLQ